MGVLNNAFNEKIQGFFLLNVTLIISNMICVTANIMFFEKVFGNPVGLHIVMSDHRQ